MSEVNYNNCSDELKLRLVNSSLQILTPVLHNIVNKYKNNMMMTASAWKQIEHLRDDLDKILKSRIVN
jgi:hypothetical protein